MNTKQNYAALEDVRVVFDHKTKSIVLSSNDSRLDSGFMLTVKRGSPASESLKKLLIEEDIFDPSRQTLDKDFDGITEILNSTDHREVLIVGKREAPRLKFALDIANQAKKDGISALVVNPSVEDDISKLLWEAKTFLNNIRTGKSPHNVLIQHYRTMIDFHKNEQKRDIQYSTQQADREQKRRREFFDVIEEIGSYRTTSVVGVGLATDNSGDYRFVSFPSHENTKTKDIADNFRVGTQRLQNVMNEMELNNYVMYAEGDLRVGTVLFD